MEAGSDHTLCEHGVGDLHEAGDVRADDVVLRVAVLLGRRIDILEDVLHDALELCIDFLEAPGEALAVLAHLERRGRNAAGVCSLARCEEHAGLLEHLGALERRGHVCALGNGLHAVLDEDFRILLVELVLRCAGESDVALDGPNALALVVLAVRAVGLVGGQALALDFLDLLDRREVDALRVVDPAGGIGHRDDLCAHLDRLFRRVDRNVAGAGDDDRLALELHAVLLQHRVREIEQAVAGRLRADERAAVGEALAGEHALIAVADALVLAVEIADLSCADADVARRNVRIRADVAVELRHEALAERHDLAVALALRVEIGAALAAADRQACQGILEDLLEAEELDDTEVDGRVQAQAALIRADCGVELHAVAAVDVHLAAVVNPRHAELDLALRLGDTL